VGFSSAGAGALGTAALLSLTSLTPAQVVGTDILFGFLLSLIGSGAHGFFHGTSSSLLQHLVIGGLAGVALGTIAARWIPKRPLRFALWVWLLVIGSQFIYANAFAASHKRIETLGKLTQPSPSLSSLHNPDHPMVSRAPQQQSGGGPELGSADHATPNAHSSR
jgi:uncharacterized membrane protein YfcA